MTKKDFDFIASVLKDNIEDGGELTIAYNFADRLGETNPLFNTERFIAACGITDELLKERGVL